MTNNKEEWKEVIDGMEPRVDMISLSRSWLKNFITNLLRTERESAEKGQYVEGHHDGWKEGRQQAYAEVRGMVEEMRKVPAWHKPNINGDIQTAIYAAYNKALTDLLTKLEEKEGI